MPIQSTFLFGSGRALIAVALLLLCAEPSHGQSALEVVGNIGSGAFGLIEASDGNFYGVERRQGASGQGTVFRVGPNGANATVAEFIGANGADPRSGVIQARDGHLYGTTSHGGAYGWGVIYRVTLAGAFSVIHDFGGGGSGAYPVGALVQGSDGYLYGTTYSGGTVDRGTAFRIAPDGTAFGILHQFAGGLLDAASPISALIEYNGAFYGRSREGGFWRGTIFRLDPDGRSTVLHSFVTLDEEYRSFASSGLLLASDGNFYGTTPSRCATAASAVTGEFFRMSPAGVYTIVQSLLPCADVPTTTLMEGRDGAFYAVGSGSVLRLHREGAIVRLQMLSSSLGGFSALGAPIQGRDGHIYGASTDNSGGVDTSGVVFRLRTFPVAPPVPVLTRSYLPVALSWAAVPGALGYSVSRRIGSGGDTVLGQFTETSFIDRTAPARQAVSYSVTAIGVYANSAPSSAVTAVVRRRVAADVNGDGRADLCVFRRGAVGDTWWVLEGIPFDLPGSTASGGFGGFPVPADYDGDGKTELFEALDLITAYAWFGPNMPWGRRGDILIPADYNGDGRADVAVFRPATGEWLIRNVATIVWGAAGDIPVPADYDGDGTIDIAVYRPATATWHVRGLRSVPYGRPGDIPVPADYDGDGLADVAVFRPSTGTWFVENQFSAAWGVAGDIPVPLDRDGDGRAELVVFRPDTGWWYAKNRTTDGSEAVHWGAPGDIPIGRAGPSMAPARDSADGDRKADPAVFRPSTGRWYLLRSVSDRTDAIVTDFGTSGDVPVARDYDGDGKTDPAVYRPPLGRWFILQSSTEYTRYATVDWGLETDVPVPADYDGDGKADVAVFRAAAGKWLILQSSTGTSRIIDLGAPGDVPVPGDYDHTGRAAPAVFTPSTGRWSVVSSRLIVSGLVHNAWGLPGDIAVPADYDGDGTVDIAVFRPSEGRWYIRNYPSTVTVLEWGTAGDIPVPADYDADGKADLAVFRPSDGTWYVRGLFTQVWGMNGDVPAVK